MKHSKRSLDEIIDNAARAIREEPVDPQVISQSATRVWERISQEAAKHKSQLEGINKMENSNHNEQIRGCEDFQSLVPAYLEGKLSKARTLLLEDHSNECVPCRKELIAKRNFANAKTAVFVAPQASVNRGARNTQRTAVATRSRSYIMRAGVAAALVLCLGIAGLFLYERVDISGTTLAATVENASGEVLVVSDSQTRTLATGEQLKKGETVRTAKDSNAVLRLADGSSVEMRERSEFSVSENMRGVTLNLDRGDVIVEAAKQHNGRLYVQTPDSLVSVKGTIFAVESGTKGSRVSVVEGEVKVKHAGKEETLLPGDQATTSTNIDKAPVKETVAWSRNAAKYAGLVTELGKLRTEVARVNRPGVRYTSNLVELVPTNTVFYAALPNITESLAESQRIMQERIKQNPALAEWAKGNKGSGLGIDSKTMARIQEFGSQLGEEVVVAAEMDARGEPSGILVLGELKNAASFRTYLDGQIAKIAAETRDMPNVRIVEDPMTVTPSAKPAAGKVSAPKKEELYVWINGNILAASPQIESLRGLAAASRNADPNRFANSSFHQRIAGMYRDGVGLLVAADLERIVGKVMSEDKSEGAAARRAGFDKLGVTNLRHFVVEQKEVKGKTLSQANLTFAEANRGIASWLAAPGSMGALDFISPNANVATAFVVKEPALLVDDLLSFFETVQPDVRTQLASIEQSQGISLRNDFAAPLGGEFAFAIDGPLLPTPSWKVVMEVYDQAKLQNTFQRAVEKLNQFAALHGKGKLAIESSASGDRTYYTVKSADAGLEVNYTFANGYFIAAPTRALLEQSLRNRDAGNTLVRSSRFISSLPQDGNTNFSAIFYHDLAPLMGTLGDKMKAMGGENAKGMPAIDPNAPPTLAYAYAQGDRITLATNTEGGAFGLSPASLLGMPNSFQMQHILMNAMDGGEGHKK
jgi:ferric-dicitrate binding protein FerR (iron transport regulator)